MTVGLLTWPTEAAMPVYMEVRLMVTNHHQQVNIVQSASGSWTLGRQIFANTLGWPCRSVVFTPQTGSGFSDDKITSEEQSFVKLCKLLVF